MVQALKWQFVPSSTVAIIFNSKICQTPSINTHGYLSTYITIAMYLVGDILDSTYRIAGYF